MARSEAINFYTIRIIKVLGKGVTSTGNYVIFLAKMLRVALAYIFPRFGGK
jgi:hypothetical protein